MSKKHRTYGIPPVGAPLPFDGIIWDTHTHLDMVVRFLAEVKADLAVRKPEVTVPDATLESLVDDAAAAGVLGLFHNACELDDAHDIGTVLDRLTARAATHPGMSIAGAAAIHPNEAVLHEAGSSDASRRDELLQVAADGLQPPELQQRHRDFNLAQAVYEIGNIIEGDERVRMVGETGLDYFRTAEAGQEVQRESFRAHLDLAKQLGVPVQIHDRNAHADVLEVLQQVGPPERVVFHSFSGDREFAELCSAQGYFMSFSGPVTFKNNTDLQDAFRFVWATAPELLLTETDAPFLTPEPFRGAVNAPSQIPHTLRYLADKFDIDLKTLCAQIAANSQLLL